MNKSNKKSNRTKSVARKKPGKNEQSDVPIHYVLPFGNGWIVKNSKLKLCTIVAYDRREAIYFARTIAKRRGEKMEIHERNGKILKYTYE